MSETPNPPGRLAVVLSHPTQYYSPWFRWLRAHTSLGFKVFYLWDFGVTRKKDPEFGNEFKWDVDLLSGYDSEFVPNASKTPGAESFMGFNNPGLTGRVAAWRPDALLVFGYKWASHLRVIAWARLHSVPLIFRGDSHLLGRERPSLHVRASLRVLYSQFASFLCVGAANRSYFKAFGVPDRKLFMAPHSVDDALFDRSNPRLLRDAQELRSRMGLSPSMKVILFAGKLVPAKQPAELLEVFLALRPADAAIVFIGEGPEKEKLLSIAAESGANAHFLPFANQSEMPARFLLADIFALPSRGVYETWGLAVNEAMHMGIPCLVSDRVGCQQDLVTDGETGWVFRSEDPDALGKALSRALTDLESPTRREKLRNAVDKRIAGYTYGKTTEGLIAALAGMHD